MKLKFLAGAAAVALFAACGGPSDKPLSSYSNASDVDSLSFYLGEMYAQSYAQKMRNDSTIKNSEAYIKGMQAGLEALREGDDAYNAGFIEAIQLAQGMRQFKEQTEVTVSKKMLLNGFRYALVGDSARNDDAQSKFAALNESILKKSQEKNAEKAESEIKKLASQKGFKKNAKGIYEKVVTPGAGNTIVMGDSLSYSIEVKDPKGKSLEMLAIKDQRGAYGSSIPAQTILGKAFSTMKAGETASFLISAGELFSNSASQIGLKNSDIVTMTITVGKDVKAAPAKKAVEKAPAKK